MKHITLLLGGTGLIAGMIGLSQWIGSDASEGYTRTELSALKKPTIEDAKAWLNARYIDPETGERISDTRLKQIDAAFELMPQYKSASFIEQGPDNIGGRTRAIQVDKVNPGTVWAGGVSGGLFKSTDGANSWSYVDSYEGQGYPYISAMAQFTNGTLFVATGSLPGTEIFGGNGVWYTTDNGATWQVVPGTENLPRIPEIVAPEGGNTLWMATNSPGVLKKWNFGDSGLTDVPVGTGLAENLFCTDDGSVFMASMSGNVYVSTDTGNTWVSKASSIPSGGSRTEFTVSSSLNSSGMHSAYVVKTNFDLTGMYVSHDDGNTWSQFVGASAPPSNLNIYSGQGWYNTVVSVTPDDPEKILIGGIDIWKWKQTTSSPAPSGGFEKLTQWFLSPTSSKYAHADNHEMKWDGNRLYLGNDGGVAVTENPEIAWYPANRGYNVTQFYGIAFDKHGAVMGGTQDNGSLYNDHTLSTWKEFREVGGGDGFQCEISFYNPDVMFITSQNGNVTRSGDGGVTSSLFVPDSIPSTYDPFGVSGAQNSHPFHTNIFLAEYYDTNSEDSVTFIPNRPYSAGESVLVPSMSTGDSIDYTITTPLYFDDTLNYTPALSVQETSITNSITGQVIPLDLYTWAHHGTAGSGSTPPSVGDSLSVQFPGGTEIVVVQSLGTYTHYYAQHPITSNVYDMGVDSVLYNVAWDRVRVQDPYQSWFLVYVNENGGELWGTRNALRLAAADPHWGIIAQGLGNAGSGSNYPKRIDIEFTKDLNHLYITVGGAVIRRIDGLGSIYTSDPAFETKAFFKTTPPTATTANTLPSVPGGNIEGIAVNPNDPDDLLIFRGFAGVTRASNGTTSPTYQNLSAFDPILGTSGPAAYDGIIDRDNPNILVVGTSHGVVVSETGGTAGSWTNASNGFTGTPVFEVRQSWRTWDEGNFRPGEIYIGTYGRGIWSSASYLGIGNNNNGTAVNEQFNTNLTVYPNPTQYDATVKFDLATNVDVKINVYNLSGRLVKTVSKKGLLKGTQTIDIPSNDLRSGIYIVKFDAGSQHATAKFIKR